MTKRILAAVAGVPLVAVILLAALTGPALAHECITQDEFEQAARDGKLKNTGLKLTDKARGIFKGLAATRSRRSTSTTSGSSS